MKDLDITNIIFGLLSILSIISGFINEDYRPFFWSFGASLLVVIGVIFYFGDIKKRINFLYNKFSKIEESLNIYDRLNKLEVGLASMKKKGQAINLLEIIKWLLAIVIIYAFIKLILSN